MPFKIICAELEPKEADLIGKITKQCHGLHQEVEIIRGVEAGKKDKAITDDASYHRLLFGEDVAKHTIIFSNHYIRFNEGEIRNFKPLSLYLQPKIIVRRVASELIAAFDTNDFIVLNTLYCLTPKNTTTDLIYLSGLLNSRLLSFWFKKTFVATDKLFPYIRKSQLELVPIAIDLSYKDKISDLVKSQQEKFDKETQKEIDDVVYKLYGLTSEEIKVVEKSYEKN